MSKKYVNENYVHSCDCNRLKPEDYICSILDMGFPESEVIKLLRFYLFCPPTINNNGKTSPYGPHSLKDYGWLGNNLNKLEGKLLNSSGISMFCLIKCNSIAQTLDSMNLKPGQSICVSHPRAVLQQDASLKAHEDGSFRQIQKETRMECLFRHLRNSVAHNRTYLFPNGNVLLEDCPDDGKSISARILMPKDALPAWAKIVTEGPGKNGKEKP